MANTTANRHTGGKKGVRKPSQQLLDYRWAWNEPASGDDTEGRKNARKALVEAPETFRASLERMEKQYKDSNAPVIDAAQAGQGPAGAIDDVPAGPDVGVERSVEMYEELLRGIKG